MGRLGRSKTARTVLGIVVGLALLGGAFYGGRVYQNNADQKLFVAYNPPQSNNTRAGINGTSFGSGGGFGSGGNGGGFGSGTGGFGRGAGLAGTITALGHGTITVQTQQGGSQTVKLTALTSVYRVVAATREGLKAGSYVSVGSATVNGRQVAADVVEATTPGTMATVIPAA